MIVIDNTIISDIITEKYFCCDLSKCNGACCIEGDAGAPLESDEVDFLIENFVKLKWFLPWKLLETLRTSHE